MSQDVDIKMEEEEDQDVKIKIEVVDLDDDTPSESEGFLEPTTAKSKRRRPPTSARERAAAARRARERRANETPEERKARLEVHKRAHRRRMARETPEERKVRLAMHNESQRLGREALRLRSRNQRKNEPPEKRALRLQKLKEAHRRRMARETPEERKARVDMHNLRQRLRRGGGPLDSQSLEAALIDPADNELREEVKQILIEKRKQRRITWEEAPNGQLLMTRAEMLLVKRNYQQFLAKQKRREAMSEEELARDKQLRTSKSAMRWAKLSKERKEELRISNYLREQARKASLTPEEREKELQKQRETNHRVVANWTEEQRKRHRENCSRNSKRLYERDREKHSEYQRSIKMSQTPEERQRTLLGYKISQAKRLLKKKLEKDGVATPEEIQEQVDQLGKKMQSEPLPPLEKVSEYKPRPPRRQGGGPSSEVVLSKKTVNLLSLTQLPSVEHPSPTTSGLSSESQSGLLIRQTSDILGDGGGAVVETGQDLNSEDDEPFIPSPSPTSPALPPQPEATLGTTMDAQYSHDLFEFEQFDVADSAMDSIGDTEGQLDIGHDKNVTSAPSMILITSEVDILEPVTTSPPPPPENKCPHCPQSFPQLHGLHSHIRSTHPEKCWKCPKCSTLSPSPQQFSEHYKSSHQSKPTSFVEVVKEEDIEEAPRKSCGSRSRGAGPGRRRQAAHEQQLIKTFPFTCMKCPVQSRRRSCSKTSQFETHEKLTAHVRVSHPKDFFPCHQCKLLKYNEASLKIHLRICRRKLKELGDEMGIDS